MEKQFESGHSKRKRKEAEKLAKAGSDHKQRKLSFTTMGSERYELLASKSNQKSEEREPAEELDVDQTTAASTSFQELDINSEEENVNQNSNNGSNEKITISIIEEIVADLLENSAENEDTNRRYPLRDRIAKHYLNHVLYSEMLVDARSTKKIRIEPDKCHLPLKYSNLDYSSVRNGPEHDGNPSDGSLTVLRQVTELKFEVNKMPLQIDRIEKLLSSFMTENVLGKGDNDGDFLNNIPLGSVDAITSFDSEIKSDKRKFKKLAHLLYLLGGDTTQKIVYSHMNKLITNEAGVLYSGQGKKKKLPFMNLTLYNVILVATRKWLPTATEVDIKNQLHFSWPQQSHA
ncbi:hypothetical protein RN001_015890 [Aquatica leii]|uniref:DUF4806 domain-containing protein n=1 Tax=Aquatica leii TaxID=1421715 RepID=A0AAN7NYM0_9COLE|nr:hypothetical protein RN001_015890 [Aquatica leii]